MTPFKLLTIDDHPVVLSGLRSLFSTDPRFELCGEARTPVEACRQAGELQPDMIVTELVHGGADGVGLITELRLRVPRALVLVYSSLDEMLWARHAVRAGACGYVSKAEPLDEVPAALDAASHGAIYVSTALRRRLDAERPGSPLDPHDVASLSARELQILTLIGSGRSLQDMSQSLGLSVKTVGTYRERLKTKLGFDTARMLERFAARHGAGRLPGP